MSSIIPGYEYDIFISYRQKDNKYDGWVTEFVNHLKDELEATFKEDISIYFDENPHDGFSSGVMPYPKEKAQTFFIFSFPYYQKIHFFMSQKITIQKDK